jgi:hypothetical protein
MFRSPIAAAVLFVLAAGAPSSVRAQGRPDPQVLLSAQREAVGRLAFMDGEWRGSAWHLLPSGEKHTLTQTERVGPFLDGAVKVIEGRGYESDGSVGFNALAVISFDPGTDAYTIRAYSQGNAGNFVLTPTADGFYWEIPAGQTTIRYTAVVGNGTWREVGDRIVPGRDPIRFFEMTLARIGDSGWPAAGAVEPE